MGLHSQTLLKENTSLEWNSWKFVFPKPIVYKEEGGQNPKLTIYPAKEDDFFVVVRVLPFPLGSIDESKWEKMVFTRPKDFQKQEVMLQNTTFVVFEADQIRNQNLLHNQVWISKEKDARIWVWVQWKKSNAELGAYLGSGSFLSISRP